MKILGLIPARGGSKGIRGKNIKLLEGKPLISFTISSALASKKLDQVVVSTEDSQIAEISEGLGASIPFLRPDALATDTSPTIDTVAHALKHFQNEGIEFDAVCLLQATTPFRAKHLIDEAIDQFEKHDYDSLLTVKKVPHTYNPHWTFLEKENGFLSIATGENQIIKRRQDLPNAYFRDGSIYISKAEVVLGEHSLYGSRIGFVENNSSPSINIDNEEDWKKAEEYIQTNGG